MNFATLFTPQWFVESVLELDAPRLRAGRVKALLLDVDCTLKRYTETEISPAVRRWLADLEGAGIKLCLVSNGLGGRIRKIADQLQLPFVAKALKPLPFGCRRAMRKLGVQPAETAFAGDQIFADVIAGRLAGVTTILVRPLHPEEEPWFSRLKRPAERWLLRHIGPESHS